MRRAPCGYIAPPSATKELYGCHAPASGMPASVRRQSRHRLSKKSVLCHCEVCVCKPWQSLKFRFHVDFLKNQNLLLEIPTSGFALLGMTLGFFDTLKRQSRQRLRHLLLPCPRLRRRSQTSPVAVPEILCSHSLRRISTAATPFRSLDSASGGGRERPLSAQTKRAPAGIASSSMSRFSFSPRSADSSIPQLSCPIILRGGRFVTATSVLPTSASG